MVCSIKCPYFPNMDVLPGNWVWDEKMPNVKRRKTPKVFKCGYDGHNIDWNRKCPRKENKNGK